MGSLMRDSPSHEGLSRCTKLYPICHGGGEIHVIAPLQVDLPLASVHFWDPMLSRQTNTGDRALQSAAMPRGMMITTIMMTTTRERGAFG